MTQHRSLTLVAFTAALLIGCSSEKLASEYLSSANAHLQAGETNAALIETRNAVAQEPENPEARYLLGELELMVSNPVDAESALLRAVELGITRDLVVRNLAQAYLLQGKTDKLLDINVSTLTASDRADVLAFQAEAAMMTDEPVTAARLGAEALLADPVSASALTANARLQVTEHNIPKARTYLATATDSSPGHSPAWELLGDIEFSEQRFPEAIEMYSQAVATASNQLSPLFKRARTHLALSELEAATDDIKLLESANLGSPVIKLIKAEIQLREGKFANAQISLEQALKNFPSYPPVVRMIAITHMLQGNIGQAEQHGLQYMDSEKSDDARILLATIRLQAKRYEQAENTLQPLTESGRLNVLGAQVLATTLLKQNKLDDAINTMLDLKSNLERAGIADNVDLAMLSTPTIVMANQLLGSEQKVIDDDNDTSYLSERDLKLINSVEALTSGDTDAALEIANSLLVIDHDNPAVHALIGRIYVSAGDTKKAAESLSTSIEMSKTPGTDVIMAAMIEVNSGFAENANKLLNSALNRTDGRMRERVLLALATVSAAQDDQDTMLNWLKQAHAENPSSYRTSLVLANYYAGTGDNKAALDALSQLSNISKNNPDVVELKANTNIALENFDDAVKLISPMLQLEPNTARWHFLRAKANAGKKILSAVDSDLDSALRIDPGHAPSLIAKANLAVLKQDLKGADALLAKLMEIMPDSNIVKQLGKRIDAARQQVGQTADNQKSDKTQTTSAEVMQSFSTNWGRGKTETAITTLTDWLDNTPDDVTVRLTLAYAYNVLERQEDATIAYREVLEYSPNNFVALNNLAWQLREVDPEIALELAERAVNLPMVSEQNQLAALDTLALIQLQQNKLEAADETLAKIWTFEPKDPMILYHGAMIQSELGKKQEALSILEQIVRDSIDFPESEAAQALYNKLQREL